MELSQIMKKLILTQQGHWMNMYIWFPNAIQFLMIFTFIILVTLKLYTEFNYSFLQQ